MNKCWDQAPEKRMLFHEVLPPLERMLHQVGLFPQRHAHLRQASQDQHGTSGSGGAQSRNNTVPIQVPHLVCPPPPPTPHSSLTLLTALQAQPVVPGQFVAAGNQGAAQMGMMVAGQAGMQPGMQPGMPGVPRRPSKNGLVYVPLANRVSPARRFPGQVQGGVQGMPGMMR